MENLDFIFVQLIGAIGYALLSMSYFRKKKIQILYMQIIANTFFVMHYFLLDGITGAISNVFGLITFTAIYYFDKKKLGKQKNILALIMIILLFIAVIYAYQDVYSLLPFIAFTLAIISFLTNNEDKIRKFGIVVAVCWLVYAIVCGSYAAIVFEVITLISTIAALIKNPAKKNQ